MIYGVDGSRISCTGGKQPGNWGKTDAAQGRTGAATAGVVSNRFGAVDRPEPSSGSSRSWDGLVAEAGNFRAAAIIAGYEKEYLDAITADATDEPTEPVSENSTDEEEDCTESDRTIAPIVESIERYLQALEAIVYSATVVLTDEQQQTLEKTRWPRRKIPRPNSD